MSLKDNERKDLVNLYLDKARQTVGECEIAIVAESWGMAANRMYYALFHAVTALLVNDGIPVGSHRGVKALFGQHYVLTGKFTSDNSKLLAQMETLRDKADYNIMYVATREQVMPHIGEVKKFIDEIEEYVESTKQ